MGRILHPLFALLASVMNHSVSEMVTHYHEERPHQAKENDPLIRASSEPPKKRRKAAAPPPDVVPIGDIKCRQRLGGLLKHYSRKAAKRITCPCELIGRPHTHHRLCNHRAYQRDVTIRYALTSTIPATPLKANGNARSHFPQGGGIFGCVDEEFVNERKRKCEERSEMVARSLLSS